jgi:hypothetical protein
VQRLLLHLQPALLHQQLLLQLALLLLLPVQLLLLLLLPQQFRHQPLQLKVTSLLLLVLEPMFAKEWEATDRSSQPTLLKQMELSGPQSMLYQVNQATLENI